MAATSVITRLSMVFTYTFASIFLIASSCLSSANAVEHLALPASLLDSNASERQEVEDEKEDKKQEDEKSKSETSEATEESAGSEKEQDDDEDKDDSDDDKKLEGQDDLDNAFLEKVNATSTRDLDKVAQLCKSAIEKGLKPEAEEQAKQLWTAVLMDYSKQLEEKIFGPPQDRRWRLYRREALKRLKKVTEISPSKTDALVMSAKLNGLPGGDREAARMAIEKAIEQITDDNKKLSEAILVRATLAEDLDAVLSDLSQAIKIDDENIAAISERGRLFMRMAQSESDEEEASKLYKSAMKDFKVWLKTDEKDVLRHITIAETFRLLNRLEEATEIAEMATEKNDDDTNLFSVLGQIYIDDGKNDKAIEALGKAIEIDKRNANALALRASVYLEVDKLDKALEDADEVSNLEPEEFRGRWIRSIILSAQEKFDDATVELEGLIDDFPNRADGFKLQLASVYNAAERPSKAIEIYDDIITSDSTANIFRGRADAYLSIGKHKEAIRDYEKSLKKLPKSDAKNLAEGMKVQISGIQNNLSWVLSTSPKDDIRDGKRALELAKQAADLTDHKRAFILSTLASAYAETGDFEKARKWAKKAVELAESDEQRKGLQDELDSYKKDEAWRELEDVEGDKKEDSDDDKKEKSDDDADDDKQEKSENDSDDEDKDSLVLCTIVS